MKTAGHLVLRASSFCLAVYLVVGDDIEGLTMLLKVTGLNILIQSVAYFSATLLGHDE